ncbi:hypothetical protein LIER_12252 [Lithospermum erythrorhizon]|uniref:RNase H type-1 domain-containing protein n=1 Tax=Lithospermum erythrorhizon TaxID=34254 RepID=A0AAV3PT09_LITER
MISERGIEPNPEKIQALLIIDPPKSYKEVKKLTGCLAAMNSFISKSGERNLPVFKTIRRMYQEKFVWDEESNRAFAELKEYLGSPQLLSRPEPGETLQLYLAISDVAVSSVLIRDEQAPMQQIEKIADSKGFQWSLHVDGARNDKEAGAGVLIAGPEGITMEYALRFEFSATINEAEYEHMLVGLTLVKSLNITEVLVKGDSKLMIDWIQGKRGVKNEVLKRYHSKGVSLVQMFTRIVFMHIPREENEEADRLSRLATSYYYVEMCTQPAYEEVNIRSI